MEEIAARAGLRMGYRVMDSFADVSEAMDAGHIDIIPNSGITPDRAAKYDFTAPVETFVVSIFVRDDTLDISGADDLRGHRVGVVEFNIGQRLMRDRDDLELVVYRDAETALFSLVAGQVDAMVFPQPVLMNLARQVGIEDRVAVVGMIKLRLRANLARETRNRLGTRLFLGENFDRHVATHHLVLGFEYLPHPSLSKGIGNHVRTQSKLGAPGTKLIGLIGRDDNHSDQFVG